MEVWMTTNQQPWVEALAAGVITAKTRTSKPVVPVGSTVLLHASKSRLWPQWKSLHNLLPLLPEKDPEKWGRGVIAAIGIVEAVGPSEEILTKKEAKMWDVREVFGEGTWSQWNSVADYTVRFRDVKRLEFPVPTRGFQAPFARAWPGLIDNVLQWNPKLYSKYFEHMDMKAFK